MGLFARFQKNHKELDAVLIRVANNAANNYKDAAQEAYREFLNLYEDLKKNGSLNEKQIVYYDQMQEKYEKELRGFYH